MLHSEYFDPPTSEDGRPKAWFIRGADLETIYAEKQRQMIWPDWEEAPKYLCLIDWPKHSLEFLDVPPALGRGYLVFRFPKDDDPSDVAANPPRPIWINEDQTFTYSDRSPIKQGLSAGYEPPKTH